VAYLVVRRVKGSRYYYIAESKRKGEKVVQKTLEYLGLEPTPERLKKACAYWKVGTKPKGRSGKRKGRTR
jgi:hypothetical protein